MKIGPNRKSRLRRIVRVAQQRRKRAWVRLGMISASIAIGLLGAALVRTHTATPTAGPSPFIGSRTQGRTALPAGGIGSAAIAQRTLASTLAPDMTVQPDRDEGSPAPAAPEKSPAVAPAHRRAGDELTLVVPSEPPSYDARREQTFALIHPAVPHSNTLLRPAMLSAGGRHAGSVLSVGPDSLVVDELGRAGKSQRLHVTVTPRTRIIVSQRNPQAPESFTDTTISLAEVTKGDFVSVDMSHEGSKLVAASVTVTLRGRPQ
jgi:hypothetical protein